jgi:hypothetical protein
MPPDQTTEPHQFEETPRRPAPRALDPIEPKPVLPIAAAPDDPQRELGAADVEPQPSDGLNASGPDDSALTAEFLRNSPVLSSLPRPVPPRTTAAMETFESPTASALQALSAMVGEVGVPEGQRARARAALLDMARQLESREMTWDQMRDAVQFLMEVPPLARRALPLLLPYLDQAA